MTDATQRLVPLSDQVRALGGDDALVREIQKTEGIAMRGVAQVAANGKFPHWPIERWLLVAGIVANSLAYTFGAGGTWRGLSEDVGSLKAQFSSMSTRMDTLADRVNDIRVDVARNTARDRDEAAPEVPAPARTPFWFPRSEHLIARPVK